MSGSGDGSVRVTIGADASNFTDGTNTAGQAADKLAGSLNNVGAAATRAAGAVTGGNLSYRDVAAAMGNAMGKAADFDAAMAKLMKGNIDSATSLKQLTPEVLGTGTNMGGMAAAIIKATGAMAGLASAGGAPSLQQISDASIAAGDSLKSAADSAAVFNKALNPTPLQMLRDLMRSDVPQAAKQTALSFQAIIDASTGVDRSFKSAADSAAVFSREINRIPAGQLRSALTSTATATRLFGKDLETTSRGSLQFNQGVKSAADSARFFEEQLDGTTTPLQKLRAGMEDVAPAAQHAGGAAGGMAREIVVLARELTVADASFSRIAGTMVVIAERSGGLMNKLGDLASKMTSFQMIGAAAFVAVGAAVAAFIAVAIRAAEALDQVTAAAARMGRSVSDAKEDAAAVNEQLRQLGGLSTSERAKVLEMGAGIAGITREQRKEFELLTPALKAAYPTEEPEKFFAAIITAAKGGASGVREYLREADLLTESNVRELASAEASGNRQAATTILLREAKASLDGYNTARAKQIKDNESAMALGPEGAMMPLPVDALPAPKLPQAVSAESPEKVQGAEDEQKLLAPMHERAALVEKIADLTAKVHASSGQELSDAQEALKIAQAKLALMKDPGDSSWASRENAALDQILEKVASTATNSKKLAEDENRARIKFWDDAAKQAGLTEAQITQAHANAARARIALAGEELRGGEAAAKKSLQDRLSELSAEQAANHDNFAKVMELEAQKVAMLRAAGSAATKQLNEELAKQSNLEREHTEKLAEEALQRLATERSVGQQEIAERKAVLEEAVAEGKITVQQEIAGLRAFADEKHALELDSLAKLRDSLGQETAAYRTAANEWLKLDQQFHTQDAQLQRQAVADQKKTWDAMAAPVESSVSTQIGAVLRGQETMSQAVAKAAGNIIVAYAEMAAKRALQAAGESAMQVLWTGTAETQKTALAGSGAAARAAITQAETATQNTGLLARLARWIATEFGFTSATAAGNTSREGTDAAAAVSSAATQKAFALGQVTDQSVVAGAAAFADSALLGPVGLAAAPGAAAAASGAVIAMGSGLALDVGAWNLPSDVSANLHAGEMVVPANFADGLRGAMSGGGSGAGGNTLHYSPTVNGGGGADLHSLMRAQAASFKSFIWHSTRNGSLALPGRR